VSSNDDTNPMQVPFDQVSLTADTRELKTKYDLSDKAAALMDLSRVSIFGEASARCAGDLGSAYRFRELHLTAIDALARYISELEHADRI